MRVRALERRADNVFIFSIQDGAGRIHHRAALFQNGQRFLQQRQLRGGGIAHQLFGKRAIAGRLVQQDRAAAAAWRVQQNLIKPEKILQLARVAHHDVYARCALLFQIVFQLFRTDLIDFAGCDIRTIAGHGGHLRGFPAGSRGHIQNVRALLRGQRQRRQHGGQAL